MLFVPPTVAGSHQTNLTGSSRLGTTVTAGGTSHSKGSWTSLIDPTSHASYGVFVRARNIAASGQARTYLLDIGYGPTAGGSEVVVVPNINCSQAGDNAFMTSGKLFYFPCYIPAGVNLAARSQANLGSDTVAVAVYLCQQPLYPWSCGEITDYGTDLTNSRGTALTSAGNDFGSWVELSAGTARAHRFWAMGPDGNVDTTLDAADGLMEIGVGEDVNNVSTIMQGAYNESAQEEMTGCFPFVVHAPVPAGKKIFGRFATQTLNTIRGLIAYGMD